MNIGLLKETLPERRVAMVPVTVAALKKLKVDVLVETGAGSESLIEDSDYASAGATVLAREEVISRADLLVYLSNLNAFEKKFFKLGSFLVATVNPLQNPGYIKEVAAQGLTLFSLELVPRTTRAQAMDVLSSMATIAGYKAVLSAASHLPKFFPMFMSAAGTIKPAKVLILGAGVAGLQALAIARKLGAVVEVFDVRSAVKEEVKSLGGKFVEVDGAVEDKAAGGYAVEQTEEFKQKQASLIHDHSLKADVIITTAQIPGKSAPLLIRKATVEQMKPGSVIIDLAASTGGNCELTINNEKVEAGRVTIIGESNFPASMPADASFMLSNNYFNFLKLIIDEEGKAKLDFNDEIIAGACAVREGSIVHERLKLIIENLNK